MKNKAAADEIIEEFRESKQRIRQQIAECQAQEHRLFRELLDRLQNLEDNNGAYACCQRDEYAGALD